MPTPPRGAARWPARLLLFALISADDSSNTTSTSSISPSPDEVEPGLVAEQYDFETGERTITAIDQSVSHWGKRFPRLAIRWSGLLRVEAAGMYRFRLTVLGTCDLELDGKTVLALRADAPRAGGRNVSNVSEPLRLAAGDHALTVRYAEESGLGGAKLEYQGPDNFNLMTVVPPGVLFHARGPCRLTGLPGADDPPCATASGVARWALGDGEACRPRCTGELRRLQGGAPASGAPAAEVRCEGGRLAGAAACRRPGCGAPAVPRAGRPSCQEGDWIEPGGLCTPSCLPGFQPSTPGALTCSGSALSASFSCAAGRPCNLSGLGIAHSAGAGPCNHSGQAVPHGATCLARCEPGYEPSTNLTCKDGQLEPLTLFECASGGAAPAAPASGAWGVGLDPGLAPRLGSELRAAATWAPALPPWAAAAGALVAALTFGAALPQIARCCCRPGGRRSRTALVRAGGPEDSEGEGDTSEDGEEAATHALLQPRAEQDPEAGPPQPGPPAPPPAAPPAAPRILQSSWRPLQVAPAEGAPALQPGRWPQRALH